MIVKSLVNPGFLANAGIAPVLDIVPGAAGGWSMARRLRKAYDQNAFSVIEGSGFTKLDVGFAGNVTNLAPIPGHCGAAVGTSLNVYDQTTNGRNINQATNILQPQIYNGSSVNVGSSGFPLLKFDGINDYMRAVFALADPVTYFLVCEYATHISGDALLGAGDTQYHAIQMNGASPNIRMVGSIGGALGAVSSAVNTTQLFTAVFNGASSSLEHNNDGAIVGNAGTSNPGGVTLGAIVDPSGWSDLGFIELIIYPSALSAADILKIKTNLNYFYGIY